MFDYASLERRVAALEANRGASLRFGTVVGASGGFARVRLDDGQGMVSAPLPTLQGRVLKDQDFKQPDDGEPVAVLFSGQGLEAGVVLGARYSGAHPSPERDRSMDYHRYEDGTEIWYDRVQHKLAARIEGDAELETRGGVTARAGGGIRLESATGIVLKAPTVDVDGPLRVTGHVRSGDVSLQEHVHSGVEPGAGSSGKPKGAA